MISVDDSLLTSNVRKMTVELSDPAASALSGRLSSKYPWASLSKLSDGLYEVVIDAKNGPRKVSGGTASASKFLSILDGEPMPDWESVNTLTKYHITTSAVESLR